MGTDANWNNEDEEGGGGGHDRMLVRWQSPKCQTAYRLLSPCNLNSQHQSDKLSDRPREWRTCLKTYAWTHTEQWIFKKRERERFLILLTVTGGKRKKRKRRTCECSRLEPVRSTGFSSPNSTPLFWIYSSDSSPGSVTEGSATSSFEGSAEVTAQTLFTVSWRAFFSPSPPPSLPPAACAAALASPLLSVQRSTEREGEENATFHWRLK